MSYNGSGTFNINSAGQPVVSGTVISSTAFNALTADLATGLTTALTKDGQTTPTANITLGGYKITNLAAGTAAADAVRFSQLQSGSTNTYITAAGADTITGTVTPTLTAYTTGQQFSFVAAGTNTTAVTLNIDGVGAKAVTRAGTTALAAGDILTGQVALVEYDGTQFQLLDPNAFTNLRVSGTLGVTGVSTFAAGSAAAPALTTTGDTNTGIWFPAADTVAVSTAGAERMRIDTSGNVGIGGTASGARFYSQITAGSTTDAVGKFEAAIGSYTGDSILATNSLLPASTYNLLRCLSDSDGDAGGPFTAFKVDGNGLATVNTATGGLGYGTGAGGAVTQATSKATAVTLNKPCGTITLAADALASNTTVRFTFNNSILAITDTVILIIRNGVTAGAYLVWVDGTAAGSCTLAIRNISGGSLSDAVALNFSVIKGVTA